MITQVGGALAAEGLLFGEGNAGDAKKQIKDGGGSDEAEPAPRGREREKRVADPNQPLEKVVGVAAVAPEAAVADEAAGGGVALEGGELRIGDRFAQHGDEPQRDGRPLDRGEGGARVGGDEQEGQAEDNDGRGLLLEEPRHAALDLAGPALAHGTVARVFGGVVLGETAEQMGAEAQAPKSDEQHEHDAARGPAGGGERVEAGEQAEGVGPDDVHKAVVVEAAAGAKGEGEKGGQAGEGEERRQIDGHGGCVFMMRQRQGGGRSGAGGGGAGSRGRRRAVVR